MAVGEPDIRPTDLQFIPTALREAFPTATVTAHPRPASLATLFRVNDGPILRQLRVPERTPSPR